MMLLRWSFSNCRTRTDGRDCSIIRSNKGGKISSEISSSSSIRVEIPPGVTFTSVGFSWVSTPADPLAVPITDEEE